MRRCRFDGRVREAYDRTRYVPKDADGEGTVPRRSADTKDADGALYEGFFPDEDRDALAALLDKDPSLAGAQGEHFEDARVPELIFRYRARNHPDDLTEDEQARWREHCRLRHLTPASQDDPDHPGKTALDIYTARIAALRAKHPDDPDKHALLDDLEEHGRKLTEWLEHEEMPF